ncbi:MAG: TldD/PmbA family protein [Spirochaetes bacterium]|nr:TldD/PmbA family protein [Spirochaetota bacterium]
MIDIIKRNLSRLAASYSEIHLEKRLITSLVLSNGMIEDISKKEVLSGNIRILHKGQWGFVSFSNISDLDGYIEQVLKNVDAALVYSKLKRRIKPYKKIERDFRTDYRIDPRSVSLDQKYNLLVSYDSLLKKFKKVINRKLTYIDKKEELFYGNSEGSLISQDKTFTGMAVVGVARDGNNIQIGKDSWGGYEGYEIVKGHEEAVEEAGRTAQDLLKAEMAGGGRMDVIIDPKLSGVFAHEAFGHLSEADFIFENPQMMDIMQIGKSFGIEELSIVDDGSMKKEAGSVFADDEGVLADKTYLIKKGTLFSRLHSRETAQKMDEPLTGNARAINASFQPIIRMTNTYIEAGTHSLEEMLSSVDNGIYAVDYVGGQTNLEMFTFSAGRAYKVEKGKVKGLLKNVVLTGNVFETLKNIRMIGNDLKLFGGLGGCGKGGQSPLPVSTGGPHMKIENVLVGGV